MHVPQLESMVTFRLYVYITAKRDIQLHHRGFNCEDWSRVTASGSRIIGLASSPSSCEFNPGAKIHLNIF